MTLFAESPHHSHLRTFRPRLSSVPSKFSHKNISGVTPWMVSPGAVRPSPRVAIDWLTGAVGLRSHQQTRAVSEHGQMDPH